MYIHMYIPNVTKIVKKAVLFMYIPNVTNIGKKAVLFMYIHTYIHT
jgi:hypothetical protein